MLSSGPCAASDRLAYRSAQTTDRQTAEHKAAGEADHTAGLAGDQGKGRTEEQHQDGGGDREQGVLPIALARERHGRDDPPDEREGQRRHQRRRHREVEITQGVMAQ